MRKENYYLINGDIMETYEEKVYRMKKEKSEESILNSNTGHAKILIEALIEDANNHIYILSDSFKDSFYENIKTTMLSFLSKDKDNTINVVTTKNGTQKTLKELDMETNFKYKYIDIDNFPPSYKENEKINFLVNDNKSYRFEYSDAHFEDGRVDATASFNNEKNSSLLIERFKNLNEITKQTI